MGFFANIIQDSRRTITADVRVPAVTDRPIFAPAADNIVSEVVPPADISQTLKGAQLRPQAGMPLEVNSGLKKKKMKRGHTKLTTNPQQAQAVQQESGVAPDVTPSNAVVHPQSMMSPVASFNVKNNPTQSAGEKEKSNLVSVAAPVPVYMVGEIPPVENGPTEARPEEPNGERKFVRKTTRSQKTSGNVIGTLGNTDPTRVQVTDVQDVLYTLPPRPGSAEHTAVQDPHVVDAVHQASVVEATDVRHASKAVPIPAMPGGRTRDVATTKQSEPTSGVNEPRVQIGQVNIVVEGPSDSQRQPANIPSGNDLASRTFLRSL